MTQTSSYSAVRLNKSSAGEILTLQRAAFVSEAAKHEDFGMPPLTQTLDELRAELTDVNVVALGVRDGARLVGAVRLRLIGDVVELGRLTVAPDMQGQGIGTFLLHESEFVFADAVGIRLFTGDRSTAAIRLYGRCGYVETGRTPVGGYSLVHFVKSLGAR